MKSNLLELELFIAHFLRKGVIVSAGFIFVGWILQVKFDENVYLPFRNYQPVPLFETVNQLFIQKNWSALIGYAGLLVLISLPILRVVATGFIFTKQRNFRMLGLVMTVLFGLSLGIFLGFVH